jgi:7-carboxy-7-deazaguanine synthase
MAQTLPKPLISPQAPLTSVASDERQAVAPLQEMFYSFQGEGVFVGVPQLFVRFAHCHLKCAYCDTPMQSQSGQFEVETTPGESAKTLLKNPVSTGQVVSEILPFLKNYPVHSISFTGGEPLLYVDFIRDVAIALKETHWTLSKLYLETSGTQPDRMATLAPWTDIVAMDIKLPSATGEVPQFEAHQAFYQVLAAHPQIETFVKLVFNDRITDEELAAIPTIVTHPETPIILQPETSLIDKSVSIQMQTLVRVTTQLSQIFQDVRVIPQTHKMLQIA